MEQRSGLPSTGQGGGHRWGGHRKLVLALGSGLLRVSRLRGRSRCVWGSQTGKGPKTHTGKSQGPMRSSGSQTQEWLMMPLEPVSMMRA